jgi:hypothetical protein
MRYRVCDNTALDRECWSTLQTTQMTVLKRVVLSEHVRSLVAGGLQPQTGTSRNGVLFMRTKSLEVLGEDLFSMGPC